VGDQLGDQPLPAEKEPGIIGFVAAQALVGADHPCQRVLSIPPSGLLLARAQFLQVDHVGGQLGLDQAQVAPAGGGLPGGLLQLTFHRRVRPLPRCLVHQQRQAAGVLQDRAGGILCCRRALVQAEDLGDLLPAERAEPSVRRAARFQPFDQPGKPCRGCLFPVGTQHQEPPGDGRGRKTSHSLQPWCLGQVEVIQDQQDRPVGPAGQHVGKRLTAGGQRLASTGRRQIRWGCAAARECIRERLQRVGR
jgi:hypothetical protein